MKYPSTRRSFLAALLASAATAPAWAKAPASSPRPVARGEDLKARNLTSGEDLVAKARLDGEVSYAVADLETGLILEAREGARGLPPASVAKALTALYALDVLGPNFRFTTRVMATGPLEGGVLKGDLVLVGGGDPTLDTDDLAELVGMVKAAGLTRIEGGLKVHAGVLPQVFSIDPAQPDHLGYSPGISGLNLNFNRVHFKWERKGSDYEVTMSAPAAGHQPEVKIATMEVQDRDGEVYTYEDTGTTDAWTVRRAVLGKGGGRWLPMRKPALYAGEVFAALLKDEGIEVGPAEETEELPDFVLASIDSLPLREVLRDMLEYSTNLTAEVVGMTATAVRAGIPADLRASAAEMNLWAAQSLGMSNVALVDHSGLGADSRVSAAGMAAALVAAKDRGLAPILKRIAMRDDRRQIVKNHPLTVRAKTGTLHFVSGLAGYISGPGGTELAFAIFTSDLEHRAGLTRAELERPEGSRAWNTRARILQQRLIDRWGAIYRPDQSG